MARHCQGVEFEVVPVDPMDREVSGQELFAVEPGSFPRLEAALAPWRARLG